MTLTELRQLVTSAGLTYDATKRYGNRVHVNLGTANDVSVWAVLHAPPKRPPHVVVHQSRHAPGTCPVRYMSNLKMACATADLKLQWLKDEIARLS